MAWGKDLIHFFLDMDIQLFHLLERPTLTTDYLDTFLWGLCSIFLFSFLFLNLYFPSLRCVWVSVQVNGQLWLSWVFSPTPEPMRLLSSASGSVMGMRGTKCMQFSSLPWRLLSLLCCAHVQSQDCSRVCGSLEPSRVLGLCRACTQSQPEIVLSQVCSCGPLSPTLLWD